MQTIFMISNFSMLLRNEGRSSSTEFLDEQVEEEKSIEDIIAMLRLAKDDVSALLFLNDKMGSRTPDEEDSGA